MVLQITQNETRPSNHRLPAKATLRWLLAPDGFVQERRSALQVALGAPTAL